MYRLWLRNSMAPLASHRLGHSEVLQRFLPENRRSHDENRRREAYRGYARLASKALSAIGDKVA
jgi:hypothetical protein